MCTTFLGIEEEISESGEADTNEGDPLPRGAIQVYVLGGEWGDTGKAHIGGKRANDAMEGPPLKRSTSPTPCTNARRSPCSTLCTTH